MTLLDRVRSGRIETPWKKLVYGIAGIGKSTYGAQTPKPIFLCAEQGTEELDVARLPPIAQLEDVYEAIDALIKEPHDFKSFVIDTLDALNALIEEYVCRKHGWKDIDEPGYGRGQNVVNQEWRRLLARIEELRNACKMNVLFLAHSEIKRFANPAGEAYDRFQLKLPPKVAALVQEWCDGVFFAEHETHTFKQDGRTRGQSSGRRIIHTERDAAWDAKNRWALPSVLPLDFTAFEAAKQVDRASELEEHLSKADTERAQKVRAWIEKQPNRRMAIATAIQRLKEKTT